MFAADSCAGTAAGHECEAGWQLQRFSICKPDCVNLPEFETAVAYSEGNSHPPDDGDDSSWLDNPWGPDAELLDPSHPFRRPLNEGLNLPEHYDTHPTTTASSPAAESHAAEQAVHAQESLPGQHAGQQSVKAAAAAAKPVKAHKSREASRRLSEKDVPLSRINEDELEAAITAAHAQTEASGRLPNAV